MGNVTQCMAGKLTARVMRPDGNIVEYDYCIRINMLMALFPGYLVIHCSTDAVPPGERPKFEVMEIVDRLRLGHSYILYPIPPKYIGRFQAPPLQMDGICGSRYLSLRLTLQRIAKNMRTVKRSMATERKSRLWRLKVVARAWLSVFARRSRVSPELGN